MTWLAPGFRHPERVELATGHHLRPIRADDVELDYPAVMGSREQLWRKFGAAWGWPPADMTFEADRADLAGHGAEIAAHETFCYAVLDRAESQLLGCVYIDPPNSGSPAGTDAVATWWLIDRMSGSALDQALAELVPQWLRDTWGFRAVHFHP